VSVYYETAEVETCAVVKANFNANFNDYSDISDAETFENSSNQCTRLIFHVFVLCSFYAYVYVFYDFTFCLGVLFSHFCKHVHLSCVFLNKLTYLLMFS